MSKSPVPPLLSEADMAPDTWTFLQHVNSLGRTPGVSGLATLWRHLARWPGLLALIHAGFASLNRDGTTERSIQQVQDFVRAEGARLAHLRSQDVSLPDAARDMIETYVLNPGKVTRMVATGHGLARWLQPLH